MSSLENANTQDDSETLKNMGINIAVIFFVITSLIVISVYFERISS